MAKQHSDTENLQASLAELLKNHIGATLDNKTISARAADAKRGELGWRAIKNHLDSVARQLGLDLDFDESKDCVHVFRAKPKFESRKGDGCEAKTRIGKALWRLVFQSDALEDRRSIPVLHCARIRDKVFALKRKTNIRFLVDAGTTTNEAISLLLGVRRLPVPIFDENNKLQRLVTPEIMTNSIEIAMACCQSEKHREKLSVHVIGGEYDWDLRSLSGHSAENSLRHNAVHADVAIVGVTGTRIDDSGRFSFGCDNLNESRLKSMFLERSWLRILIFHSDKLNTSTGDVRHLFVPLAQDCVDIIITDAKKENAERIDALKKVADDADVELITA